MLRIFDVMRERSSELKLLNIMQRNETRQQLMQLPVPPVSPCEAMVFDEISVFSFLFEIQMFPDFALTS